MRKKIYHPFNFNYAPGHTRAILIPFFLLTLFSFYQQKAAIRYWVGGTGNWTDAANHWASASGGSPASGNLPGSSDDVYFDSNSGTGTATINSTVTIANIRFMTSCSAIILDITSGTTSVTSTSIGVVLNSGSETFRLSGGTLTITNSLWVYGGTLQLNSGTLNVNCNTTTGTEGLTVSGGTMNCAGATVNIGNGSNEVLTMDAGTLSVSGGTINVRTEFYTQGGTFNLSGGTMNININSTSEGNFSLDMRNTTYSFTGGTIDIKNAAYDGCVAVNIASTNTSTTVTGGLIKITATNGNYKIDALTTIYSLELNHSGYTGTLYDDITLNGNLTITAGTFDVDYYNISLKGNWTFTSGTFNYRTQTVTFNGSSAQQILGASATSFYNLTLNNSSGLTLAPSSGIITTVRNTLTLTSGKITLGNYDLNIGATGVSGSISGAGSSNYIITSGTGVLRQYNIGTGQRTSILYPVGISSSSYTPATLAVSGSTTVDNFSVVVSQSVLANGTSGSAYTASVVNRTWNITEGTNGGSSMTVTLQWNASDELTSFSRSNCYVSHYSGSAWTSTSGGASATGSNPYTRTSGVVTSFSPFAVASNAVLPIQLVEFVAYPDERNVSVDWTTANETNNSHFIVERSRNGQDFEFVAKINGAGNANNLINYHCYDPNSFSGLSYYRLTQVDFNGAYSYSEIVSVLKKLEKPVFSLAPNPAEDYTILLLLSQEENGITVNVYDINGRMVEAILYDQPDMNMQIRLELNQLQKGVYFISTSIDKHQTRMKLVKT